VRAAKWWIDATDSDKLCVQIEGYHESVDIKFDNPPDPDVIKEVTLTEVGMPDHLSRVAVELDIAFAENEYTRYNLTLTRRSDWEPDVIVPAPPPFNTVEAADRWMAEHG
jgi:hypothetical protein